MDKEAAILQGGFLLANKLCLPSSLSSIQKCDWERVGQPILGVVGELCKQVEDNGGSVTKAIHCKTKIFSVLWCKLLSRESGEDVEIAWRENPFFAIQNGLPEISRVVLLELVKATAAADIYSQLLLRLPDAQIRAELSWLAEHVTCSPTSEGDVSLLLDVWWELWRGRDVAGGMVSPEENFANEFARLSSHPSTENGGSAKRFKLDTSIQSPSSQISTPTDVLYILLHALRGIKNTIATADLGQQALAVTLDAIYTSFLIDSVVILPTEEKMLFLSKLVSLKEKDDQKWSLALLREAQMDLRATHRPSEFRPCTITLPCALQMLTELTQGWQLRGLLKMKDSSNPGYFAFRLDQSVQRALQALESGAACDAISGEEDRQTRGDVVVFLRGVQESLAFPTTDCSLQANARLTMFIIDHRLEDYQDFAALFATEAGWVVGGSCWMNCLERNQVAFQQPDTVVTLATTLICKCKGEQPNVSQCKQIAKVIANIFLEIPLEDKNKVLAVMLRLSSRGLFGGTPPSALADGFGQELNMAFNCIIQGGGGARAGSLGNLTTATSLVARVAFQNPEATLRRCCNTAVFNKGAFVIMAKILQQLPGLRGGHAQTDGQGVGERHQESLLCRCLREAIGTKALSANERDQFLRFLALLMEPVTEEEGSQDRELRRWSFLSPGDVVRSFTLPYLSAADDCGPINMELAVQVLHSALCVDLQEPASPHWVLECSPFPLLYVLAQHLNQASRCWERPEEGAIRLSSDTKELLVSVLSALGKAVGREVTSDPATWSRALSWLYSKVEELDWTVRFHLKPVWGDHFKNEVPSSLLAVCNLAEREWSGLDLPQYGQGSGLLAWVECCCVSDTLQTTMLSCLCVDRRQAEHLNMFSKGLLVTLAQTLPWCSVSEWRRLLVALRELLTSGLLHVPYSLEYVDYLPLLDLRCFSGELCLSVLLLRALQLLCGASCSGWLPAEGWAHVGRLYAHAIRETLEALRAKLALSSSSAPGVADRTSTSPKAARNQPGEVVSPGAATARAHPRARHSAPTAEDSMGDLSAEVLFALSQLFCHVQHVQVMMPGGRCEAVFLCALEILSLYESVMGAFPDSSTHLEIANTRHFFTTITDNLESVEMKAVLQQKIAQLTSSIA